MWSEALREILRRFHGVEVGHYSYWSNGALVAAPRGTRIGNYCSLGPNLSFWRRNHPTQRVTQHPIFYNRSCGVIATDTIEPITANPLVIEHDVWLGANSTILPGCRKIGLGAIVGACSVVTRDVEAFAIVAGNPARVLGRRFSKEVEEQIVASHWWLQRIACLLANFELFSSNVTDVLARELEHRFQSEVVGPEHVKKS